MIRRNLSNFLLLAVALALASTSLGAVTVVRPLSLNGFYDLALPPHARSEMALVNLGIEFTEITAVSLRIEAGATDGLTKDLQSGHLAPFPPLVTATLLDDEGGLAAFGEILLPNSYRGVLELDNGNLPVIPNYSALMDGNADLKFSVHVPLMTANVAIVEYPNVRVSASAAIVTGEIEGWLAGDFDGDGVVFKADYDMFRRTFGQHVIPGTGADASGNGIIDAGDYATWRNNLGASLRPTDGYLIGDYDYSGAVDGRDYQFWRARFGEEVAPFSGADGDGDGLVNAADYVVWRDQFVRDTPGISLVSVPVPEPTSVLPLAVAVLLVPGCRRRFA